IGGPVGHSLSLGCGPRGGALAGGCRAAHELGAGAHRRSRLRAGRGAAALPPRARVPYAWRSDRTPGRLGVEGGWAHPPRPPRRTRHRRCARHHRSHPRPRARPPFAGGARGLRAHSPAYCRPAPRLGQERMGPDRDRSSWRGRDASRGVPDGHAPRDGSHLPDPQPDGATARGAGPGSDPGGRSRRKRKSGRSEGRSLQYWMVVTSPDNFRKTRELGFTIQGLKSRHRRRVETMRVGDRVLYYVTGRMAFAATVTVASPMYEDHTPTWRTARRDEDYPWRVHIRPDLILEDPDWVPAKELAYRLDYVRKWPPEHWTLAFQGHIHALPRTDFGIVEDEIARSARQKRSLAG